MNKVLSIMIMNVALICMILVFSGEGLAAIPVQIRTPEGKAILSKESNGPWFGVNLPAGKYEVVASYKNIKRVLKVDMGMTPQSLELAWKGAR
jgi:hypothetical protein